jgi:hypothetical protein
MRQKGVGEVGRRMRTKLHVKNTKNWPEEKYLKKFGVPRIPRKSWKTPDDVWLFLESMAKSLQVRDREDWYRVGVAQIAKLGGKSPPSLPPPSSLPVPSSHTASAPFSFSSLRLSFSSSFLTLV